MIKTAKQFYLEKEYIQDIDYIPYEHLSDMIQATNIVSRSVERATDLCNNAQRDYDEELEKAYQEGKDRAERERLESVIEHSRKQGEFFLEMENTIIEIVESALNTILGHIDIEDLTKITVGKILEKVKDAKKVELHVHPHIVQHIQQILDDSGQINSQLDIKPDHNFENNKKFIIKTPHETIDGSIDVQIGQIVEAIRKKIH